MLTAPLITCILPNVAQLNLFSPDLPSTWSVGDVTRYVRDLLESDFNLQDVWVAGEVSNVSRPRSGHLYFTIKDADASLKCVMWKPQVARLRFMPREGDGVEVHGKISVYAPAGSYQLYADRIRPAGQGALYQEFLRLKAKLEAEGLFEPERKRLIPAWPNVIGIVTSPTGAALQDMLNTLRRRYPLVTVILTPTAVQGVDAPRGIVNGIRALNEDATSDVILVARGGGSIEDLWAFNDEGVVRAIAASAIPIISGVGHETDFTLSDFAADVRAPTPTAAAELATPDQVELRQSLLEQQQALTQGAIAALSEHKWALSTLKTQLARLSPENRVRTDRQRLDDLIRRAGLALTHQSRYHRARLSGMRDQLQALNPLGVLQRGFAVVTNEEGDIVRKTTQIQPNKKINIRVSDGSFRARVEK